MIDNKIVGAKKVMNRIVEQLNILGFDDTTLFQLEEKILLTQSILDKLSVLECRQADRNVCNVVDFGRTDFKKLQGDIEWLIDYVKDGNALSGYFFSVYKIFCNTQLRERLYVLNEVYISGSPCNTLMNLQVVKNVLSAEIILDRVAELWDLQYRPFTSFLEKHKFFSQLLLEGIDVVQGCHLASLALENIKFDLERNISR